MGPYLPLRQLLLSSSGYVARKTSRQTREHLETLLDVAPVPDSDGGVLSAPRSGTHEYGRYRIDSKLFEPQDENCGTSYDAARQRRDLDLVLGAAAL